MNPAIGATRRGESLPQPVGTGEDAGGESAQKAKRGRPTRHERLERERQEFIRRSNGEVFSSHDVAVYKPKLELVEHPLAPLFSRSDGVEVLGQVLEMAGSSFSVENAEIREVLRQAGFVSLWFFLKVVCGYNGPYDRLTDHIHVDMCNFYQRSLRPGAWSGAFLPRAAYKSTVFTHGGNTWELLRDPDLTIGMGCAIAERAYDFKFQTQRNFDSNPMLAWLYPEWVPNPRSNTWNDKRMILPNRTRRMVSDSIEIMSVGASTQGIHVRLIKLDDIVGDAQLKADRSANADMVRITNWFESNIRTLIDEPEEDRIFLAGTRYAADDPYEVLFKDIRKRYGYWHDVPRFEAEGGHWDVYNRQALEFGESTFPERLSKERLAEIREKSPWTYWTQMQNNPYSMESAELAEYRIGNATIGQNPTNGKLAIQLLDAAHSVYEVEACDVVVAIDPASTERRNATVRTSRSAAVVLLRTPDNHRVVLEVKADYVKLSRVFDWLFELNRRYSPRVIGFEMVGAYKVLEGPLQEEQARRGEWLPVRPERVDGEKVSRIRSTLEPLLRAGQLYAVEAAYKVVEEEQQGFPTMNLKDVLDALSMAEKLSYRPYGQAEIDEDEEEALVAAQTASKYTGY